MPRTEQAQEVPVRHSRRRSHEPSPSSKRPFPLDRGERRNLLLEAAGIGEWEWDIPSGLVWRSPTLAALYGRPGDIKGTIEDFTQEILPDDQPALHEAHCRAVEEGAAYDVQFRVVRPDRTVVWVQSISRVILDSAGKPLRVLGIVFDVTGRKRATQALSAQYAVSRALLEAGTMDEAAAAVLNLIGTILGWDTGAMWMLDQHCRAMHRQAAWQAPGLESTRSAYEPPAVNVAPGQGPVGRVWATSRGAWFGDIRRAATVDDLEMVPADMAGAAFIPVSSTRGVIAVIQLMSRTPKPEDAETLESLIALGHHIGEFIERRWAADLVLELSTPVLPIAEQVLLVPVIGVLDPPRLNQLAQRVLGGIRSHRAKAVVIDATGVAFMDSTVASRLIATAESARLLGARVVLTGLSAEACATLVGLKVNLGTLEIAGDLRSGIEIALRSVPMARAS